MRIADVNVKKYTTILSFLLLVVFVAGLSLGTININLFQEIFSHHEDMKFILQMRIEREIMAICCGGMLATGSAMLQDLTGNKMVAPDLIGMTSVACLLIIICNLFWIKSPILNELLAITGSALGFLACLFLAKNNIANRLGFVLIGVSISFALSAVMQLLILNAPESMDAYFHFMTGSLYATQFETVLIVISAVLIALPVCFIISKRFLVFSLDSATCHSIGVSIKTYRISSFLLAAFLVGSSVVGVGHLGFLGIVAPNLARLMVGNRPPHIFILSFLVGGLIYLFADILGRCLISPVEIPAGMLTNILGAPLFIYILFKYYRGQYE